ncbi:pentatricopeptide repeat-containing protein At1g02060, chloroplastic-like [Neltuma alba]|uniref:pentatricopeptide repeat-containing protein At1g02060, chloroplastic-like n=1 Tax=Neltuma alba TaxID=207710 RepID=UPI0010A2F844|nr:pentatricopeptide repeat-containing protein At1g02060, chloroplastic-like [Prosopis alba]
MTEIGKDDKPKSSTKSKTAKAMARLINSKPLSNELASSLSSLSPALSKTTVLQTLRLLTNSSKAFQFFKWVHDMGFPHNDQSYFLMLVILGCGKNFNVARNFLFSLELRSNGSVKLNDRLFNSSIRSYGQAGLFEESMQLFQTMKTMAVSPSVITFNSLLSIGRTNITNDIYDEMLRTYGVAPDTCTYNILIRGFCKNSMVDGGFRFFNEMSRFNCDADIITYNTLLDGLCKAGKVKIAHDLAKGMSKKSKNLNPNVVTCTTLIGGHCMQQKLDEALSSAQAK